MYRVLAELFGIGSYLPWRLTALAIHLGCCALVYVLARRRLGPWWALVPLALVLVTRGWETVLWPFQMGQMLSILCGLGALVALDRRDWRGDLAASLLLVLALASSSFGPPLVLAVAVELVLSRWRALWVLVAPAAAYLWWHFEYNAVLPSQGATNLSGIRYALELGWDIMPGGPAAVLGTSFAVGRADPAPGLRARDRADRVRAPRPGAARRPARRLRRVLAPGGVGAQRIARPRARAALRRSRASCCSSSRSSSCSPGWTRSAGRSGRDARSARCGRRPALGPVTFMIVVLIAARGVVLTADAMKDGSGTSFRVWGQRMLAQQAALGVGREALTGQSPFYIETAGGFALALPIDMIEATAARWGGDLYRSEQSLRERPMDARRFADQALARAQGATVVDVPPAAPLATDGPSVRVLHSDADVTAKDGCVRWSEATARPRRGPARRAARRATPCRPATSRPRSCAGPTGRCNRRRSSPPGRSATVKPRPDRSSRPWQLEVFGGPAQICSLPPG